MEAFVSDTMAVILHLEKRKMPQVAKELFQKADIGEVRIYIPAMAVAEIGYLSEKGKIELSIEKLEAYIKERNGYIIYPQDLEVIRAAFEIDDIPELHDKLIAGTAKVIGAKIITNDPKIEASSFVRTVWK